MAIMKWLINNSSLYINYNNFFLIFDIVFIDLSISFFASAKNWQFLEFSFKAKNEFMNYDVFPMGKKTIRHFETHAYIGTNSVKVKKKKK